MQKLIIIFNKNHLKIKKMINSKIINQYYEKKSKILEDTKSETYTYKNL